MSGWRHKAVQSMHEEYGDLVRLGPNAVSINSRKAISPIYAIAQCLDRSRAYSLPTLPGDGLFFMLSRNAHNPRRSRWAPAFTATNLELFQNSLNCRTSQLSKCIVSRCNTEHSVDLATCIEHWSYDFMGDFVFGPTSVLELMRDGDPEHLVQGGKHATVLFDILGEVPWLLDILWYFPTTKPIKKLHNWAHRLITQRQRSGGGEQGDVSSYLLAKENANERDLTEEEKVMDALFAIQAGSDTSANILQYALFFLVAHQGVYRKLHEELEVTFSDVKGSLDSTTLASLPYLNAVVNESLRLGTPLSGLPRVVPPSGMTIEGRFLPGGTVVSVPVHAQHYDSRNFWPQTDDFVPERWLPEGLGVGSKCEPSALMSFSFGPFGCLGRNLAMQELRIVVARLVLDFELTFPPNFDAIAYRHAIRNIRTTLFPSPLRVIIKPRRPELMGGPHDKKAGGC